MSSSPITQVSQYTAPLLPAPSSPNSLLTTLHLDLRGNRFDVDREMIMNLPESVLLCLFPNGLVLTKGPGGQARGGGQGEDDEEEVYFVDFDPSCFSFVLNFFRTSSENFYSPTGLYGAQQALFDSPTPEIQSQNPLYSKQAIIVLREELEYFSIPVNSQDKEKKATEDELLKIKNSCGTYLLNKKRIFTALQRNVNRENNLAEQHLIDMLCMSGFSRDDEWGFRALEPTRCCISSIALVLLKTGITQVPQTDGSSKLSIDYQQMATAQKLLLFWRKPARKCWWDGFEIALPSNASPSAVSASSPTTPDGAPREELGAQSVDGVQGAANGSGHQIGEKISEGTVKLWARRVWTLELSLI